MNEPTDPASVAHDATTTPTGTQSATELGSRRLTVLWLVVATTLGLALWLGSILSAGGWSLVDVLFFVAAIVGIALTVLGFWNSMIGLALIVAARDPLRHVLPDSMRPEGTEPITSSTAILMTLRNEDPARAFARLAAVHESLEATGAGEHFTWYVLSDTSLPDVAAAEEAAAEAFRATLADPARVVYRRREQNTGYKAGNIADFVARWGNGHDFMLPLDADSLMDGPTILGLVRVMQRHPRLGMVQSLITGLPSRSAFARIFQFGARVSVRSSILGYLWYYGDCATYWGHNAVVRIAAFRAHGGIPDIDARPPFGGPVMSHDLVESWLLRRGGYEVRVLPILVGSWEENPPTVLEYSRREVRWAQGTMQYWWLLAMPGLLTLSRLQMASVLGVFVGMIGWTLSLALLPFVIWSNLGTASGASAIGLYLVYLAMFLTPKLVGLVDVLRSEKGVAAFGGAGRFGLGFAGEILFAFLMAPVTTFRTTVFLLSLPFGRSISWGGQQRDPRAVSWAEATASFWPQLAFGAVVCGLLLIVSPMAFLCALPLVAGYLLGIPFAVLTAHPEVDAFVNRRKLFAVPEEFDMPDEVRSVLEA